MANSASSQLRSPLCSKHKHSKERSKMRLPPYEHFPTISDDRLSLRQIQISDINDLIVSASPFFAH